MFCIPGCSIPLHALYFTCLLDYNVDMFYTTVCSIPLYVLYFRCLFDYVDMFTIDPFGMKHPEDRFCGQVAPVAMVSIHRRVELVFKSDIVSRGTNKGFLGKYQFIEESE